jgi:chromosome partitioning protein
MNGSDLFTARRRLGLNQSEFASWLNQKIDRRYTKQTISNWEHDRQDIPVAVVLALGGLTLAPKSQIVAFANQKGGVAKTTLATNVAAFLAKQGQRVLLIDADAQANATLTMDLKPQDLAREGRTLYHVISGEISLEDAIIHPLEEFNVPLDVVPSSLDIEDLALTLVVRPDWSRLLQRHIRTVAERYDHIIIDCPPNLGVMTANALTAADRVLIPSEAEPYAVYGINLLFNRIAGFQEEINPALTIAGIIPTKFNTTHSQDAQSLADIHDLYGDYAKIYRPIPKATVWTQAAYARRPLVLLDTKVPGIEVIAEICADLMLPPISASAWT